jgi:trimeric autotransporter adhesin
VNHIYRLVWSQVRRTWLVVSELARGRGKAGRTSTPRRTRSVWWAALPFSLPMLALAAAPVGVTAIDAARPAAAIVAARAALAPAVIAPVVSSTHPTGGQVTAGSGRIDVGDHLTTIQQDSQNLSLDWSSFNIGAQDTVNFLQPNAQSIAVNRIADPNGSAILGHLNANGQVFLINPNGVLFGQGAQVNVGGLVASTLDVSDSELGRGTLHFAGAGRGSVINLGTLTAAPGGYVALLGHAVSNQGAIHAPAGSVALAGGSAVTLSFDGSHLLDMQVDASTLNALAENKQLIVADGGQVLMSAGAKDALLASVVNNTGTIQARTVENRAGKIVLLGGMAAGTTQVDGTLDASAPNGGSGGFVETSAAHVQVADGAKITTLAAAGNSGSWLIDPHDFTIAADKTGTVAGGTPSGDISGSTLSNALSGGNVDIESSFGSNANGSGDIHVNDVVSWSAHTLTLTAARDIDINAVMTASGSAGLLLNPGSTNGADAAIGGTVNVMPGEGGRVDFTGSSTLSINNHSYTIITSLGAEGSTTRTDLQGISGALYCACYFALGADIDASATASWAGDTFGSGFLPIGHSFNDLDFKMFMGTFDGLGHTISGLTINRPGSNNVGLFGYTLRSTIRNIGLLGESIEGESSVGGLVGYNNSGTISDAYAIGVVNGNHGGADVGFGGGAAVGGLVGYNDGGRISQAYASGAVSGVATVGGLVGYNNRGPISQAYATGTVSSSGGDVGGLIGINDGGPISQAYATGTVRGSEYVGGLVGYSIGGGTISQAYATGAVSSSGNFVGGLVGRNDGGTIDQAYATGAVSSSGSSIGGLDGFNNAGVITNSYWDTETTGQSASGNSSFGGGTGLTTKALIAALPRGFTATAWGNVGNQTTPYLLGMSGNRVFNTNDLPTGTVTRANRPNLYTVILDLNQLQAVGSDLTGRYVLGNDIDASASIGWAGVEFDAHGNPHFGYTGFEPIGGPGAPFTGTFDGLGHTINSLNINRAYTDDIGLFGITGNGSAIRNLGLLGGSVTGQKYVGGLVGNNNGTISQAYVTGVVNGKNYVGGLVGDNGGTITNTYATGVVSDVTSPDGIYVGGLVGRNDTSGKLTGVYATNSVMGNSHVGGLVGDNLGAITNAYATGEVTGIFDLGGGDYVGGLVGYNDAGGTITDTYATGAVSGSNYVGGLVASSGGGTVTNGYWNTDTTRQRTSDGGGTGLTTAQMMDPASFAAWGTDISAVGGSSVTWRIYAGDTAPLLRAFMTGLAATAMNVGTFYNGTAFAGSSSLIFGTLTPGYWLPSSSMDASLILGDANARTSTPATNAGSYALTGDLYSSQMGYDIDFTPGTLTIAPATLTYLANTATTTYGSTPTGLTGKVTGFVNGETLASATTGSASFTTGATATSNVGNYAIVGNGLTANYGNYTFAQAAGNAAALTVNPATLTITANDASKTYGDTLTFAGNEFTASGLQNGETIGDVALASAGAAATANVTSSPYTITSNTATGGSFDTNNYAITYQDGSLTVDRAALTVTAKDDAKTYDGLAYTGGHGVTYSGFVNGETASVLGGTLGYAGDSQGATNAGGYTITPDGLIAGNYAITYQDGSLTVGQAALTYLADIATATYGDTPSGLTGTLTGFVNGETQASATTGTASFTTGATATSNVGSYAIDGSGLTANYGNYAFVQAAGNAIALKINPAMLTYTATLASSIYGSTPSGLTGTVTGFVNGQTQASATTGTASFTTGGVIATSDIGNYAIDGSGLTANYGNYTFAQAAGNAAALTVNPATLTITANDASKTYGDTLAFAGNEFTASGLQNGETIGDVALASAGAAATASVTSSPYTITSNTATGGSFVAYNYAITYQDGSLTVDRAALTVTAKDDAKTYDGLAYTGGHGVIYSGFVNGETTSVLRGTLDYTGDSQGAINAGGYTITPDGLTAGNYAIAYEDGRLTVDQAALTVGTRDVSKTYDGGLSAIGTAVVSGGTLFGSDTLSGGNFAFTDKNVGTGKHVTVNGVTVSDGNSGGNYAVTYVDNTGSTITARGITVDATGANRTYDGTTADAVTLASTGLLVGDTVLFSGIGAFGDKNVGVAKTISVSGIVATGADANNYSFNTTANTMADISQLGITVDATGSNKVYDGSTTDAVALVSAGVLSGDAVNFTGTGAFANKNVGTGKTVSVSGIAASGSDAGNYTYNTTANTTADISQLGITVDATGTNRVYDGTSADAVALASTGVLSGDTVNFTGTGAFANKNVGTGKAVSVSGIAASGSDAGNYSFSTTANTTADISQLGITVDASGTNRVYDGTTTDAVSLASAGLLVGDTVNFNGTGAFGDKNVGVAKAVVVNGIVATGADAGNYSYNATTNTTADISPLGITVDATGTNRVYDGTTADVVNLGSTGILLGDTVRFSGTGAFGDKNVGVAKAVGVSGIVATGADANNYSYNATANTTADISLLGITVDATATNKVYDGSTVATIAALGTTGLVAGDAVTFGNTSAAFDDKNAGTGKTVTVSGIVASGADANNYSYNTTAATTADITALGITVDATGTNRVYDGTHADTVTLASAGVLAGDTVHFAGIGSFDDKNVGVAKNVSVSGIAASGADAGNYSFSTTANTTADISQLGIIVDATGMNRVYDGTTADAVALTSAGVLSGDTVNFTGTGSFTDRNVGTAKAVGVSGIAASGADAGNYSYNTTANTTADISRLGITVGATGANKVYDGSTADTVALASAGVLSGDTVNFTGTGAFANKNVGTGKTVSVSGIAAGGSDANNYSYNTTANTTADISQLGIIVDATGTNRVYDGSTADAVVLGSVGVLSGDTVSFTGTGHFADKNVGAGKSVNVSGIVASGSDAGNYSYNAVAGTAADITPATLTYRANAASFWTGQIPGDLDGTVTGLVGGDTLAEATAGTLGWNTSVTSASPAGTYAIDGSGLSALNYIFAQAAGNAAALRVANGSAPAAVTAIVAGLQRDDMAQDRDARTLHAPDVRVVGGGVRLP